MSQTVEHLRISQKLPDDIEEREAVINRAMDVRSGCLLYLAAHLPRDIVPLGDIGKATSWRLLTIQGKVFKTFFIGDEKLTDASVLLERTVARYEIALNHAHVALSLTTLQGTTSLWQRFLISSTGIKDLMKGGPLGAPQVIKSNYIIPYQRNPKFTGRVELLESLKELLAVEASKKYNHRVALYGMAGIGKTQCALEYVYTNKLVYDRIYWVTGVDRLSVLEGYRRISEAVSLPGLDGKSPTDIANTVKSWLSEQPNWLMVVDNLNDVTVVDGLLPENGPGKHTLLTTRNPRTVEIPAEPFDVPLLSEAESLELLETISNMPVKPENEEYAKAIVKELEYLPLALELAAAYVREVTGDFSDYLAQYRENGKAMRQRISAGNRHYYSKSVATALSQSFDIIQRNNQPAMTLIRLFAFLHPDKISVPFLSLLGSGCLEEELNQVLSNQSDLLVEALLELERFSLIKWHRSEKSISIHRLVQSVIYDEMSVSEREVEIERVMSTFNEAAQCLQPFDESQSPLDESESTLDPNQLSLALQQFRTSQEASDIDRVLGTVVRQFLPTDPEFQDPNHISVAFQQHFWKKCLGATFLSHIGPLLENAIIHTPKSTEFKKALETHRSIYGDSDPRPMQVRELADLLNGSILQHTDAGTVILEVEENVVERYQDFKPLETVEELWKFMFSIVLEAYVDCYWKYVSLDEATWWGENLCKVKHEFFGEEASTTLLSKFQLGLMYFQQGRLEEAREVWLGVTNRAKNIYRGEDAERFVRNMEALAGDYGVMGSVEIANVLEGVAAELRNSLGEHESIIVENVSRDEGPDGSA